jgi:hypothetical protein
VTNSSKEVMFLGELEEVLEATQPVEFQRCMVPLFRQIARSMNSSHFQVPILETPRAFLPTFFVGSSSLFPYCFRSMIQQLFSCLSTLITCNRSLNMEDIVNTDSVSLGISILIYSLCTWVYNRSKYMLISK